MYTFDTMIIRIFLMLLPSLHNLSHPPCTGSEASLAVNRYCGGHHLEQLALENEDAFNAAVDSLDSHDRWICVWRMIEDAINKQNVDLAIIVLKTYWRMHLRWDYNPQSEFALKVGDALRLWCRRNPTAIDGLAWFIVALGFWYNSPQMAGFVGVLDPHIGAYPAPMTKAVLMEFCLGRLMNRPDTLAPQREALRAHPLMA